VSHNRFVNYFENETAYVIAAVVVGAFGGPVWAWGLLALFAVAEVASSLNGEVDRRREEKGETA
jgi:hypothetical protein